MSRSGAVVELGERDGGCGLGLKGGLAGLGGSARDVGPFPALWRGGAARVPRRTRVDVW